jgi:hypothetical protein
MEKHHKVHGTVSSEKLQEAEIPSVFLRRVPSSTREERICKTNARIFLSEWRICLEIGYIRSGTYHFIKWYTSFLKMIRFICGSSYENIMTKIHSARMISIPFNGKGVVYDGKIKEIQKKNPSI